ncbi:hypothetical protein I79_007635 [Cricetulus griseus]|uniref:Uncharacterized protein n=1 Tax=Cricetulus griseus TaxID=10029 RepID=G3HB21_CRIGR|nr:hypothetical protein I79_007635 [Cricetulus griseus]
MSLSETRWSQREEKSTRGKRIDSSLIGMQMGLIWLSPLKGVLNFGYGVKCRCYKPCCENTVDKWKNKKVNGLVVPLWNEMEEVTS